MKPEISIIIPVYNSENTLARCVDSVLEQSFRDFEIILIDDGARDSSGGICDRYAEADGRIRVIHQENAGVSAARNTGIRNATGDYLLFLDSDDELEPEALLRYQEACENGCYDIVIGSLVVIENGICTRKIGADQQISAGNEIWEQICMDSSVFGYAGGKLVRASIVHNENLTFNSYMYSQEDLDFFLSCYGYCSNFRMIPDTVYRYYYTPSTRVAPVWDFIANQLKILRIGEKSTNLPGYARDCVCKRIMSLLYTGLYHAANTDHYLITTEKIAKVEGLREFLQRAPATREHAFVARCFAAGQYGRIYRYFKVRNGIRDIYRSIRRKKT